jgi:hypothetical protein
VLSFVDASWGKTTLSSEALVLYKRRKWPMKTELWARDPLTLSLLVYAESKRQQHQLEPFESPARATFGQRKGRLTARSRGASSASSHKGANAATKASCKNKAEDEPCSDDNYNSADKGDGSDDMGPHHGPPTKRWNSQASGALEKRNQQQAGGNSKRTSGTKTPQVAFCTQRCLLTHIMGQPLDLACPNVALHRNDPNIVVVRAAASTAIVRLCPTTHTTTGSTPTACYSCSSSSWTARQETAASAPYTAKLRASNT